MLRATTFRINSFTTLQTMFSEKTLELVNTLHQSNIRACIITAGAGSAAISALMSVPGCSKTLLDAQVPYSVASTIELLDNYPQQYVSAAVAANLSHTAYTRAKALAACPCNPPNVLHGSATATNPSSASTSEETTTSNTPSSQINNSSHSYRIVGLGATAAISTLPDRKGEDRVHACCSTEEGVYFRSLNMTKGLPRHVQEWMVSCVLLQLLADVSDAVIEPDSNTYFQNLCLSNIQGLTDEIRETIINDLTKHIVKTHQPRGPDPFSLLLDGKISKLTINKSGVPHFDGGKEGILREHNSLEKSEHSCHAIQHLPFYDEPLASKDVHYLLYPGSFAPLHYGHTELARVATHLVQRIKNDGKPVMLTFEVATSRVDKTTLTTPADLAHVAAQFTNTNRRVAFSTAKLFIEKAKMFPNHGFVVGVDTAARVLDPKYYDNSTEKMIEKLKEIEDMNCYFIVAGRKYGSSGWTGMQDIQTPKEIAHLFVAIPDTEFRVDISSTELRERKKSMSASNNNENATGVESNRSPFPSLPNSPSDKGAKTDGSGVFGKTVSDGGSSNGGGMATTDSEGRQPSWALGGGPKK